MSRLGPVRSQYELVFFFFFFFVLVVFHEHKYSGSVGTIRRGSSKNNNGSRDSRMHTRIHVQTWRPNYRRLWFRLLLLWLWLMFHASHESNASAAIFNDFLSPFKWNEKKNRKCQMKLNKIFSGTQHVLSLSSVDWLFRSSNNKTMQIKHSVFYPRASCMRLFSTSEFYSVSFFFIHFLLSKQIGIFACILIIQILNKYFIYRIV